RGALKLRPDGRLPGLAGLEPRVLVADVAGELEHQTDGGAGGRAAGRARAAHGHPPPRRRPPLAGGGAPGRGGLELWVGQLLDYGARKRRALAHGADDLEALQRLDDVFRATEVLVEHLDVDVP